MKLREIYEATTLAFADRKKETDIPLATFRLRASVRKAAQTNLVLTDRKVQFMSEAIFYIISDIPPLNKTQWMKLVEVSFGRQLRHGPSVVTPGIQTNSARWDVQTFPNVLWGEGKLTSEIWSDKQWDEWEERSEPEKMGAYGVQGHQRGARQSTIVKTMTWKEFADNAIKRHPFSKDDFIE